MEWGGEYCISHIKELILLIMWKAIAFPQEIADLPIAIHHHSVAAFAIFVFFIQHQQVLRVL